MIFVLSGLNAILSETLRGAPKTIRLATTVKKSPRPLPRAGHLPVDSEKIEEAISTAVAATQSDGKIESPAQTAKLRPEPRDDAEPV